MTKKEWHTLSGIRAEFLENGDYDKSLAMGNLFAKYELMKHQLESIEKVVRNHTNFDISNKSRITILQIMGRELE